LKNFVNFWIQKGVIIKHPESVYIGEGVDISKGVTINPFSCLTGDTKIQEECEIGPGSDIQNSNIGEKTRVLRSTISNSNIMSNCNIGPYSHIRDKVEIGENCRIGNYVEIKKSIIKNNVKISHLAYIGDAEIFENVNIGAGTITCNFDGKNKNKTIIRSNSFIGSNVSLIAPVCINENVTIAAGSVITKDVPKGSLGVSRVQQKIIKNWKNK
tara:strand:- start:13610 stop:14248 length:639 start_codon:yes stop_codon:yes gene_type:complete